MKSPAPLLTLLIAQVASALCIGTGDYVRTGQFRVLRLTPNPSTGLIGSFKLGRWQVLGGCILRLQNHRIYEDHQMDESVLDVYTMGLPCDSKGGQLIDATISTTCCDTGWSAGGIESNACLLGTRKLVELRIRNPDQTKMRIYNRSSDFKPGAEIDIALYEKDWRTFNTAKKGHDAPACITIKDEQLRARCHHETYRARSETIFAATLSVA